MLQPMFSFYLAGTLARLSGQSTRRNQAGNEQNSGSEKTTARSLVAMTSYINDAASTCIVRIIDYR